MTYVKNLKKEDILMVALEGIHLFIVLGLAKCIYSKLDLARMGAFFADMQTKLTNKEKNWYDPEILNDLSFLMVGAVAIVLTIAFKHTLLRMLQVITSKTFGLKMVSKS